MIMGVAGARYSTVGKSSRDPYTLAEKHLSSAGFINAVNQSLLINLSSDNLTSRLSYWRERRLNQSNGASSKDKDNCCAMAATNNGSP